MTASLASFQSDLLRALQGEGACPLDANSAGYRLTVKIRRSWCEGRVIVGSRRILWAIPEANRQRLVNEYVDRGGGLEMFLHREAENFFRFLTPRLPDPSHALTLCEMYLAVTRAQRGAMMVAESRHSTGTEVLRRGRYASLVWFYADPDAVIAGLAGGHLPPVGAPKHAVLFAPRLPDFFRVATQDEVELWDALPTALGPDTVTARLLRDGVIEYSD